MSPDNQIGWARVLPLWIDCFCGSCYIWISWFTFHVTQNSRNFANESQMKGESNRHSSPLGVFQLPWAGPAACPRIAAQLLTVSTGTLSRPARLAALRLHTNRVCPQVALAVWPQVVPFPSVKHLAFLQEQDRALGYFLQSKWVDLSTHSGVRSENNTLITTLPPCTLLLSQGVSGHLARASGVAPNSLLWWAGCPIGHPEQHFE